MATIKNIKALADLNMSSNEICDSLGLTKYKYSCIIKAHGYKKPKITEKRHEYADEIVNLLKNTRTTKKELCAKYDISFSTLQDRKSVV